MIERGGIGVIEEDMGCDNFVGKRQRREVGRKELLKLDGLKRRKRESEREGERREGRRKNGYRGGLS